MKNKYLIVAVILLVFLSFVFILTQRKEGNKQAEFGSTSKELHPIDSIIHAHGLAVDPTGQNLYIATHHGLFLLKNDKDLYQVGDSDDDYMGFSPNAKDSKVFFTSGHPKTGGNIGFEKSEDGGFSWKQISSVENEPVDFHAMSVSPVNPNLAFGWFQGKLYRSIDGGNKWENFLTKFLVTSLVADPKDENVLYATTPQGLGVMISRNKGQDWQPLSDDLKGGIVSVIAVNPGDSNKMIVYSEKLGGLGISSDGGKTWQKGSESFNTEEVLYIAYTSQNPSIVYALTYKNAIYKSIDGGKSWNKIR